MNCFRVTVIFIALLCAAKVGHSAPKAPGLPITESYHDENGSRSFATEPARLSSGISISAIAITEVHGSPIGGPVIYFMVATLAPNARWHDADGFTLS
ncbi:MAG TPA: hypothetical protein VGB77_13420, partial [Abditibacteriaceae bacterium]